MRRINLNTSPFYPPQQNGVVVGAVVHDLPHDLDGAGLLGEDAP